MIKIFNNQISDEHLKELLDWNKNREFYENDSYSITTAKNVHHIDFKNKEDEVEFTSILHTYYDLIKDGCHNPAKTSINCHNRFYDLKLKNNVTDELGSSKSLQAYQLLGSLLLTDEPEKFTDDEIEEILNYFSDSFKYKDKVIDRY